jgi:hypothetical protein
VARQRKRTPARKTVAIPRGTESQKKPPLLTHAERVDAVCGKYAWIPFSSDEFIAEKHKEIELEERKFAEHLKLYPRSSDRALLTLRRQLARIKKEGGA